MRSDEIRGDVIPVPEGNHRLSSRTSDVIAVADAAKVIGLHIQAVRQRSTVVVDPRPGYMPAARISAYTLGPDP